MDQRDPQRRRARQLDDFTRIMGTDPTLARALPDHGIVAYDDSADQWKYEVRGPGLSQGSPKRRRDVCRDVQ